MYSAFLSGVLDSTFTKGVRFIPKLEKPGYLSAITINIESFVQKVPLLSKSHVICACAVLPFPATYVLMS